MYNYTPIAKKLTKDNLTANNFITSTFIITRFNNILRAHDQKGKRIEFQCRYSACFILTLKGSIRFTYAGGSVTADPQHPIFLPHGLNYINECLEDADSYVFNFHTLEQYQNPIELAAMPPAFATARYDTIKKYISSGTPQNTMAILSELYALAHELFAAEERLSATDMILKRAAQSMQEHYADPSLTIRSIAEQCFISEIYLRRLFAQKYNTTPFRYLTDIRMKRAFILTKEKRPIKEIALAVGYSDVYQFSRAYKKHFGVPPSKA